MTDLRLAIMGGSGRMGQALVRQSADTPGVAVTGASEAPGHSAIGQDAGVLAGIGPTGVALTDDLDTALADAEAVIDFTTPAATLAHLRETARRGLVHVIGTTGLSAADEAAIREAAGQAVIVKSGNMSLGVNVLAALTEIAARLLDESFDVEIVEMHHRHKVDAPSGTALLLGEAAAQGRSVKLADVAQRGRDGHTGPRRRGDIGFAVLRGGGVVGDHTVMFASDHERIELTHRAADRGLFASGALRAALWARGKPPGLYSMADVLGLTSLLAR